VPYENGVGKYQYYLTDHLGNNRVVFKDNGSGQAELIQENHFYAFGMAMEGSWSQQSLNPDNNYKYNGKELDSDFGLDWYHYGARMYDPTIGVFTGVDPLADNFGSWSPYSYSFNNPIRFVDPDGRAPDDIILRGSNNSSITIQTDLVDINVDASNFIGDVGGNHVLNGNDAVITGLDIVGIVDPTPVSDALGATLSAQEGDYLGAGASVVGAAVPLIGDAAKIPKIAKGVNKIKSAIAKARARVPAGEEWGKAGEILNGNFDYQKGGTFVSERLDAAGGYIKKIGENTPSNLHKLPKGLTESVGRNIPKPIDIKSPEVKALDALGRGLNGENPIGH